MGKVSCFFMKGERGARIFRNVWTPDSRADHSRVRDGGLLPNRAAKLISNSQRQTQADFRGTCPTHRRLHPGRSDWPRTAAGRLFYDALGQGCVRSPQGSDELFKRGSRKQKRLALATKRGVRAAAAHLQSRPGLHGHRPDVVRHVFRQRKRSDPAVHARLVFHAAAFGWFLHERKPDTAHRAHSRALLQRHPFRAAKHFAHVLVVRPL